MQGVKGDDNDRLVNTIKIIGLLIVLATLLTDEWAREILIDIIGSIDRLTGG